MTPTTQDVVPARPIGTGRGSDTDTPPEVTYAPAGEGTVHRLAVNDNDVMSSVKAGSTAAFGVLYERFHEQAYRVARGILRDEGPAQEAVQETFIAVWKARSSYQDLGNVKPWLLTLARNRSIDIARRSRPHVAHRAGEDMLEAVAGPHCVAEHVAERAEAAGVLSVLAQVPDAQREVITLAFYGEMTHPEIAEHLDVPLGTVKSRIRLGMDRMRGELEPVAA